MRINEAFGDTVNWDLIPTERGQVDRRHQQQSRVRAQRARRRAQRADEGRLHLSGNHDRRDGRLLRPRADPRCNGASRSAPGPPISRSRARTTTATAIFRTRKFAASTAISATRATAPNCISISARPTIISARPAPRRSNCCSRAGATSTRRRRARSNQVGYVNATANVDVVADLERCRPRRISARSTRRRVDGNPTDVQPCADPDAALCFNDAVTPANGLNGQQLANPFAAERDARRDRPHVDPDDQRRRDLAGDQHRQALRPRQSFRRSAAASTTASPISARAPNWGRFCPNYVVAGSGIFLGPSGDPVSDGPVVAAHDQRLYRPLCARHVRRDQGLHDLRRRAAATSPTSSCRTNSATRSNGDDDVHALQSDDRRDLQDHVRTSPPMPAIPRPIARRRRWSSAAPTPCIPASSRASWSPIRR